MAKYIVVNENTLAYRIESSNQIGILHGSVIKGGKNDLEGWFYLNPSDTVRDATLEDFDHYGVSPRGHLIPIIG